MAKSLFGVRTTVTILALGAVLLPGCAHTMDKSFKRDMDSLVKAVATGALHDLAPALAIAEFHDKNGRWPANFNDMKTVGYTLDNISSFQPNGDKFAFVKSLGTSLDTDSFRRLDMQAPSKRGGIYTATSRFQDKAGNLDANVSETFNIAVANGKASTYLAS